jgi:hypothetical protein
MTALFTPKDGLLTSQNVFVGPWDGTELFWVVAPGNLANGNTYGVTSATMGSFFATFSALNREVITTGATIGSPYTLASNETEVWILKTIASPTFILAPLANTMTSGDVLIKDWAGNADVNPITINFSGSQLCDGQASVVINNQYGWVRLTVGPTVGVGATGWGVIG